MKKRVIILLLLLFVALAPAYPKIVLSNVFSDNMVLQQDTLVRFWGKANPGSKITINVSWARKVFSTNSDSHGTWTAYISTPKASYNPQTIRISGDNTSLTLKNVLIGEVWVCLGQSNMEMPVDGFECNPVVRANQIIAESGKYKGIRCLMVQQNEDAFVPQTMIKGGSWEISCPKNVPHFSASAYYFAISLNKVLDVPIGVLVAAWGATQIESWLPQQILKDCKDIDINKLNEKINPANKPELVYNGMVHPIAGYTSKGFIWYQGESNVHGWEWDGSNQNGTVHYADRLKAFVNVLRSEWKQNDMPFYVIEIAPFRYFDKNALGAAYLRESQYKAVKAMAKCGLVCTNDLVDSTEIDIIHPKDKLNLGERLTWLVLRNDYKFDGIEPYSPEFKSMEVKGDKVVLSFENTKNGFTQTENYKGFEVAGADRAFHSAVGKMVNVQQIEIYSPEVKSPVAVRYCFRNFLLGNVANTRGLPLIPFRTDNW